MNERVRVKELRAAPLTADSYRAYGRVIAAGEALHPDAGRAANQGSARKFEHLVPLESARPAAQANLSVFRCAPRAMPFEVALLEKHPQSTQIFVPMNAARYLVVVAGGGARPDLSTLRAFLATGKQGISYAPGVWHHPMIALDDETDFACLVFEDGSEGDCVEFALDPGERFMLDLR